MTANRGKLLPSNATSLRPSTPPRVDEFWRLTFHPHQAGGHCCWCDQCARRFSEPDWCVCCGDYEEGIGDEALCARCDAEMRAEFEAGSVT